MPDTCMRTWEEIGARVVQARIAAGLTQEAIADRLGIHRSAVARIERGQRHLDALELAGLAETLGRSVAWFVTPAPSMIASHRRIPSDDRAVDVVEDALEEVARDTELLIEIGELSAVCCPAMTVQSTEDSISAAAHARDVLGDGDGPVYDIQGAAERLGLLAFSFDFGANVVDGAYVRVGDMGVAVVNGQAEAGRRRFTVAHELGHHLLGDEHSTDFAIGELAEERERLINVFAIHFLAPQQSAVHRWNELKGSDDDRAALIRLAVEYRLSWSAACNHAQNLGMIDADRRTVLQHRRPTTADYIELGETFGEELVSPAVPSRFARACLQGYRRHKLGADRAVELLRNSISADDLPVPRELPLDALRDDFEPPS